jgi:hypothetical protein
MVHPYPRSNGIWSLDLNGNFAWEGHEVSLSWGIPGDRRVIGDGNARNGTRIMEFVSTRFLFMARLLSHDHWQWLQTQKAEHTPSSSTRHGCVHCAVAMPALFRYLVACILSRG